MSNTIDDLFGFSDLCDSEKLFTTGKSCTGCYTEGVGVDKCYGGGTPKPDPCGNTYTNPMDNCPPIKWPDTSGVTVASNSAAPSFGNKNV